MPDLPAIARAALALSLCGVAAASAQTLPAGPARAFEGRRVASGEVTATLAPTDRSAWLSRDVTASLPDTAPRAAFEQRDDVRPRLDQKNQTFCEIHSHMRVVVPDAGADVEVNVVVERR